MPRSERVTGTSRSLERGLAILSSFNSDRPLIGVSELSRDLALSRSTAHRYFADARAARLPPAGPRLEALPPRSAGARPRVLGHQLDGRARDRRAAPARAGRRDRVHRQPRDPRGHRRGLHRALPVDRGRVSARSISTSTWERGCRPTARPMGKAIMAFAARGLRREDLIARIDFVAARPEHAHRCRRLPRRAGAIRASGVGTERRGARLRACARSPRRSARSRARPSRRSTSPCSARCVGRGERSPASGPSSRARARSISLGTGHRLATRR